MFLGFNLTPSDIDGTSKTVEAYHKIAETFKFGYAMRSYLGDEDFVDVTKVCFQESCLHCNHNSEPDFYGSGNKTPLVLYKCFCSICPGLLIVFSGCSCDENWLSFDSIWNALKLSLV